MAFGTTNEEGGPIVVLTVLGPIGGRGAPGCSTRSTGPEEGAPPRWWQGGGPDWDTAPADGGGPNNWILRGGPDRTDTRSTALLRFGPLGPLKAHGMHLWAHFGPRVGRRPAARHYEIQQGYLHPT